MNLKEGVDGVLHHVRWIDVKSLLAGMLIMGLFVGFQENLLWYVKPRASLEQRQDQLPLVDVAEKRNRTQAEQEPVEETSVFAPSRSVANDAEDEFVIKREFKAYGSAAALFVEMAAYRGGADTFAIVGLGSKPIHVYGDPGFECEWVSARGSSKMNVSVKGWAWKMLPDWNMGRQYTVVVVNCTFGEGVGIDGKGGELILYASHRDRNKEDKDSMERIVALVEEEGEYDERKFRPPYPYDFVYCGSPLFGKINPQRIREWVAYHVKLFGPRSHFLLYDTGGLHPDVRKVLKPWLELGYFTIHDVRQEARYDGYYQNQFLIVNDCFHRTRFLSNWTFFFDVDEFLYVAPGFTLQSVMDGFSNYSQVIFWQNHMSYNLCEAGTYYHSGEWAFEKLVYRNIKKGIQWDRKYAVQPRTAYATGVHRSDNILGESLGYSPESHVPYLSFFHFHNALTVTGELCQEFANSTELFYDSQHVPFTADKRLQRLAESVKRFELEQIGPQPTIAW